MDPALPAGAVAVPVPVEEAAAAAAAPRPSRTRAITRATVKWAGASGARRARRVAWAAALLVMGFAAWGLGIFAVTLPAPKLQGEEACKPTQAEMAGLHAASQRLLLAASTQLVAATMGMLVPAGPVAILGYFLGWFTARRAGEVIWMLVTCHGSTADDGLSSDFWVLRIMLQVALVVGLCASL